MGSAAVEEASGACEAAAEVRALAVPAVTVTVTGEPVTVVMAQASFSLPPSTAAGTALVVAASFGAAAAVS